ncbi:MAG: rRNA pseudouridine synthase [Blautia sp.]|nr:rRNA pseudouridine synthase [Blautia sp.]
MQKPVRLDKYLADAGCGTRSEVKIHIQKGKVTVDGECIRKPEFKVTDQEVCLDGKTVSQAKEFVYYLLHKPAGVISATTDRKEKTVMDLFPEEIRNGRRELFPVGRLDKDTEGLLLITDDGALAHELLSPKKHVDKTYFAVVNGILGDDAIRVIKEGVDIGDREITLPAALEVLNTGEDGNTEVLLTIQEGRFHQVKRMMKAVGCEVVYLKRITMGSLHLPSDLLKGMWRELKDEEVFALKNTLYTDGFPML